MSDTDKLQLENLDAVWTSTGPYGLFEAPHTKHKRAGGAVMRLTRVVTRQQHETVQQPQGTMVSTGDRSDT
jgi:hypothetical protein